MGKTSQASKSKLQETKRESSWKSTMLQVSVLVLVSAVISHYFSRSIPPQEIETTNSTLCDSPDNSPVKYWFYHKKDWLYIFDTVDFVLQNLGHDKISMNASSKDTMNYDWDLLWSYNHFSAIPMQWSKVKFHQRVNHIPGNLNLASKSHLGTRTDSKYVPKAFINSEDVKKYAKEHPEKRFVLKLKSNRGVVLKNVTEMDFTKSNTFESYYAMEFIENPLLFNGHKFDFAVYVVITSVNPLRLYYYNKNIIMRFCPKTYSTEDPEDLDRYVVSPSHIPGSKFPGIKEYFEQDFTYKEAFNIFLRNKGANVTKVWEDVEDLIRSVVTSKEKYFIEAVKNLGASKYSFFEMFRFDLILDRDFNLYVIEINQSPNVYAGEKYINNKHIYESVLYNLFNLIGVGTSYKQENLTFTSGLQESMVVHRNSLTVKPETCVNSTCSETCSPECELCWDCLTSNQRFDMIRAYLEQMSSGEMKRLMPPRKEFLDNADQDFWDSLEPETKIHTKWFAEMCKKSEKFC